ncbi:MAG: nitroreductase [Bradymonadia bacterium]|jgi:nitroreductase
MSDRTPEGAVDSLFLERWSTRAFAATPVPQATLDALFEAARWAPSCFNDQPWLFVYANDDESLARFRPLLNDWNQQWANTAPVLGFIFARKTFRENGNPNRWASFDAGAAWMSLALQARLRGLYTHAMAGVDFEKVHATLNVPVGEYEAICAFVVGERGDAATLPAEMAAMDAPNGRVARAEIARKGGF